MATLADTLIQVFYELDFTEEKVDDKEYYVLNQNCLNDFTTFVSKISSDSYQKTYKKVDSDEEHIVDMYILPDSSELYIYDPEQKNKCIFISTSAPEYLYEAMNYTAPDNKISEALNYISNFIIRKDNGKIHSVGLRHFLELVKDVCVSYTCYMKFTSFSKDNRPICFVFSDGSNLYAVNHQQENDEPCLFDPDGSEIEKVLSEDD